MARSSGDEAAAAVAAALAPYAWREFTERMLARRVVAALDRHDVLFFLSGFPRADVGLLGAAEPTEDDDRRVDALVRGLDGQHWRKWSLARLSSGLVCSLEAWHCARDSFTTDLRRPEAS